MMKQLLKPNLICIAFLMFACISFSQNVALELNPDLSNQMTIVESPTGTYDISTTGNDPWIQTRPIGSYDANVVYVLSFDYIATEGLDNLQVFYGAPIDPVNRRKDFGPLSAASEYTNFKAFMRFEVSNWAEYDRLRFDFGREAGKNIKVKNLQLRAALPGEVIPFDLNLSRRNQLLVTENPEGTFNITTNGGDPFIYSEDITTPYNPETTFVLAFDYISNSGLDDLQIFYGKPTSPARRVQLGALPPANNKTNYSVFMKVIAPVWNESYDEFRFDFGRFAGQDIQVSNFVLREPTNEELKLLQPKETVAIEFDVSRTSAGIDATEVSTGSYILSTSGNDPWIRTKPVDVIYDIEQSYIIEFEYKTDLEYNELEIFFGPPITGAQKMNAGPIDASPEWTTKVINPRLLVDNFLDSEWSDFRFDFGRNENEEKSIQVRNIIIRKPTAQELEDERTSDKFVSQALDLKLQDYLNTDYVNQVSDVVVNSSEIIVSGSIEESTEPLYLAEIEAHEYGFDQDTFINVQLLEIIDGEFKSSIPRYSDKADRQYDRLYSRWAVVKATGPDTFELTSAATWATNIVAIAENNIQEDKASTIKGLDGLTPGTLSNFEDLKDLDIKSMKINLLLNGVFSLNSSSGLTHEFNGKTYNINQNFVSRLDERLKPLADANIKAAFVLLIPIEFTNPDLDRIFTHPDASLGLYSMANVATEEGIEYYTAMVDFLAKRYSRPDNLYGRLDQWIIHNEVDAHTSWTHAGQKPVDLYTSIYDRSMRMVHYTIRKYNPSAKVFASFTKHFNSKPVSSVNFKSKDILNTLGALSKKEGDYEWNIGWHSYPTNLFNPKVWEDPIAKTQLNFDTPEITPRNLEMIDAYVRQKSVLYNGKKVRTILLSENGFSSNGDRNPNANETNQAAALAYFWKKTNLRLPSIENIQLHRWVDNPNEAGLEFGLWTVLDGTVEGFNEKKEGWYVWEAAGSAQENEVFEPYKSVIGINSWSEIYNEVTTEVTPYVVTMDIAGCNANLNELVVSFNGELKVPQENGTLRFYNVASNVIQDYKVLKDGFVLEGGSLVVNEDLHLSIELQVIERIETVGLSPSEIEISWEAMTAGVEGFVIEVKEEGSTFVELAQVGPADNTYVHEGVTAGERYTYRIAAVYDEEAKSCFSEESTILAPFIIVDYKDGDKNRPNNNKIRPHLILKNEASRDMDLSRATVRYWLTDEGSSDLRFKLDEYGVYAEEQIQGEFVQLNPPFEGADTYVELSFDETSILMAKQNSGELKIKIEHSMPSVFNELNDYSFQTAPNYIETRTITVYWDDELIWGDEPSNVSTNKFDVESEHSQGTVYPNSAKESVTLKWENDIESVEKFTLMDYQGREYELEMNHLESNKLKFQFSNFPQGIYLLKGNVNGQNVVHRILITE